MKRKILYVISGVLILISYLLNFYSVLRIIILLLGIFLLSYLLSNKVKLNLFVFLYFILILISSYFIDYSLSCFYRRIPIYSIRIKSNNEISTYNSFLYRLYDCNSNMVFDNGYKKDFVCTTTLLENIDINKVLTDPSKFYKKNNKKFVKITGKISKINGNSSIILKSFSIDDKNTLNGYVSFQDNYILNVSLNNKVDVTNYKIYDYITVVGELTNYRNKTLYLDNIVLEDKGIYKDYKLSVIKPSKCQGITEYTDNYYTYCLSNIYVDYKVDKYELSYLLKDKKISFNNLKSNYLKFEEKDNYDLYYLDTFNIIVCNDKKTIFIPKDSDETYNLCEVDID